MLPAVSVAVAVSCSPLVSGLPSSIVNVPSLPAFPVPTTLPSASFNVTVLPGSARPVTVVPSSDTCRLVGASGAVVSGAVTCPAWLVLPDESVAVAVITSPLVRGLSSTMVNLPSLPVFPVPTTLPSASFSVTVLPGSAVPVTVLPSSENCKLVGAVGAVVSGSVGVPGLPGLLLSSSSPPPPPPVPAAMAIPPATARPPSTHGQTAAPPASLPDAASNTSVEAIDSYVAAPVGSSIHHSAPSLSSRTSWLTPWASVT